jgi:Ca2+-binding EF-hand superfamily protein
MSKVAPAKGFDSNKYVRKNLNAETVTKLKEVFDVFDYDGSGNVSTEELVNTIRALNLEAQAGQILAIDFSAFLDIFGFGGDNTSETSLQSIFEAFDHTHSGAFTAEDFEKTAAGVGEHFSSAEVDQMIDFADKDRDGAISFEEFVNVVTKVYPKV